MVVAHTGTSTSTIYYRDRNYRAVGATVSVCACIDRAITIRRHERRSISPRPSGVLLPDIPYYISYYRIYNAARRVIFFIPSFTHRSLQFVIRISACFKLFSTLVRKKRKEILIRTYNRIQLAFFDQFRYPVSGGQKQARVGKTSDGWAEDA